MEQAVSNLKNTTSFSIQTDVNGHKYVNIDTDQDIFDGIDSKDYNKMAKMYINDYLRGYTKLADTSEVVIDSKSARKYTNPGERQSKFIEKMKLTPELKNALKISEKIQDSLPTKDTSKYENWEYYKFNFKLDGQNFSGVVNIGIDSRGNKHFYEINKIKKPVVYRKQVRIILLVFLKIIYHNLTIKSNQIYLLSILCKKVQIIHKI